MHRVHHHNEHTCTFVGQPCKSTRGPDLGACKSGWLGDIEKTWFLQSKCFKNKNMNTRMQIKKKKKPSGTQGPYAGPPGRAEACGILPPLDGASEAWFQGNLDPASEELWVFQPHLHSGSSDWIPCPLSLPHLISLQVLSMSPPKHLWVQPLICTPLSPLVPLCHHLPTSVTSELVLPSSLWSPFKTL